MKLKTLFLSAALVLIATGSLFSQIEQANGYEASRNYNINTVETVIGQINSINIIHPSNNSSSGIHMSIFTQTGDMTIHLGPEWYIDSQILQLKTDDKVIVTGSRVTYDGNSVIIAKDVTKDGQVLNLRDENGFPLWSGQRSK